LINSANLTSNSCHRAPIIEPMLSYMRLSWAILLRIGKGNNTLCDTFLMFLEHGIQGSRASQTAFCPSWDPLHLGTSQKMLI